jgi:flavorubredoxin
LTRALVVCDPGHWASRQAAEEIAQGISRNGRIAPVVASGSEVSEEKLRASAIVVLGSAASAREAAREVRGLTTLLRTGRLDRKVVSVFDAGPARLHGAGVRALVRTLQATDPALHLSAPGISVGTRGERHELPEEEVVRCRQFGEHLAELAGAVGTP